MTIDREQREMLLRTYIGADHKDDVSTIICECEAGMSRSARVAAALSHILQGQNKYFYTNFEPNKWVYRTIIDEHHH
jgi:hypothetical protein